MSLVGTGFDSKPDFAPPTLLLGLLLCTWTWGIFFFFFDGIKCSPVNSCSAAICNSGVHAVEDECTASTPPSSSATGNPLQY